MNAGRFVWVLALALVVAACNRSQDRWTAFVYPPGATTQDVRHAAHGDYDTFEHCKAAAIAALRDHTPAASPPSAGSYECGLSCRYDSDVDMYVCNETRD